jgi:hypothetical protein
MPQARVCPFCRSELTPENVGAAMQSESAKGGTDHVRPRPTTAGWWRSEPARVTRALDRGERFALALGVLAIVGILIFLIPFHPRDGAETSGGQSNDELARIPVPPTPHRETAPTLTPGGTPPAVATSTSNAFDDGVRDRQAWEDWFNGLSGDERQGALHWASQRSLPKPASCASLIAAQVAGCREGQARLSQSDSRRKSDPDYRAGWNSIRAPSN